METGTDSQNSSLEQLGAISGFIIDFLTTIPNFSQEEYCFSHKNELEKKLREVFSINDEFSGIREEWQKFYKNLFRLDVDFSGVIIPLKPEGVWRLLFIPKGMTLSFAFQICEKLFASWGYYDDLDKKISKNIRNTSNHYTVWVREEVEPDQEFLGKSTNQAGPDMKIGITLLERIIFEIKFFTEKGDHLDIKCLTFCSGSRYARSCVPRTYFNYNGRFLVDSCDLNYYHPKCGIRSVFSL